MKENFSIQSLVTLMETRDVFSTHSTQDFKDMTQKLLWFEEMTESLIKRGLIKRNLAPRIGR